MRSGLSPPAGKRKYELPIFSNSIHFTELEPPFETKVGTTEHTAWRAEWQDWHAKMIAKVREVDPIRAEHVDTLGTFDIRPFYGIEASQALHDLSEFTETLERLDEFILQS